MRASTDYEFPDAYFSAEQMISRLNKHRKVFVTTNDVGRIAGYIYVEVEPEIDDASIEFFSVHKSERGKGYGKKLIQTALNWMLSFEEIESVTLCVNAEQIQALRLYEKLGFEWTYRLNNYGRPLSVK